MPVFPPRPAVRLHPSAFIPPPSAFFLMAVGCLGIAGQLVLLRELMAAYGGNEFSAGVTVAAWILCEALGAWLAGRTSYIVHRASFLAALSILASLVAVPFAVLVRPLLGVLPGEALSIPLLLLATLMVVFLPAAAHGALFVTAAALHVQGPADPASGTAFPATGGVGPAYVWEGVGTVLAGLACFFLLNRLSSMAAVSLAALPLIVAGGFGHGRTWTQWTTWTIGLGILTLLVFALPIERLAWAAAWRGQRVVSVANSPYGKIVRLERAGQQLILYDGLPVLTLPTTETERIEELGLLPVLVHPQPRRVLVLGHDMVIPTAIAHFRPDIKVVTVQLDPLLARTSLAALSSDSSFIVPRFSSRFLPTLDSLVIADPVSFLLTTHDTFDCIILTDAVPSSLGSSRLFALEFYRLCRSRLASGGILATACPGNPTGLSPDLVGIVSTRQRTLEAAFAHVLPLAVDFPLLLASDLPLDVATETLLVRLGRLSQRPKFLDSSYVTSLLDPFRQQLFASQLAGLPSPVSGRPSSSSFPHELFLNMVRENRLVTPAFGSLYARLGSSSIVHRSSFIVLFLSAVLLVVGLVGARLRGRPFSRGFAILTSGFSGTAVSSLLIFAWQVRFGSVYSGVSLLVAAFMLGTVLGGILGSRSTIVHRSSFVVGRGGPRRTAHRFFISDLALAVCAATTMLLIRGGPAGAFLVANCLAGACLGFQFAVAGSTAAGRHSPFAIRRSTGVLTALDLAGGSIGGILTALVFVPVFGIGAAALSAGAVKLASVFVQLAAAHRVRPV